MSLVGHWKLTEDSLHLGSTIITNGGMEGTYVAGVAPNWEKSGTPTVSEETTDVHGGSSAQRVSNTNHYSNSVRTPAADRFTMTAGKAYKFRAYVMRKAGTGKARVTLDPIWDNTNHHHTFSADNSWELFDFIGIAGGGSVGRLYLCADNTDTDIIWDDISVEQIYFEDETANNNHGTPANPPVFTTNQQERANRATVFNGSTDKIDCGTPAILDISSDVTVLGWINLSSVTNEAVARWSGVTPYGIKISNGRIQFDLHTVEGAWENQVTTNVYVTTGSWQHVAVVRDGTDYKFYYNGSWKETKVNSNTPSAGGGTFMIGAAGVFNILSGNECNVRIYNTVLSEDEIANIYNSELFWHTELIKGQMDFAGKLSAQNPNWLLLDKSLNWLGEWDETYSYNPYDAVLYKTSDGNEWHIFVSKISHNVGNVPTTSPAAWRRYYQEQML